MELFFQQLLNGVSLGGTYALLALGLAIVFTIMHLVNFAHGELITIPGYVMYALFLTGAPWQLYAPVGVLSGVVAALAMDRLAFRPVRGASPATLVLTSLGLSIIIQGSLQTFVSPRERGIPQPAWIVSGFEVLGLRVQTSQALTIAVTFVALFGLRLLLRRTRIGIAMRAAAGDFDATRLMGIRANRVIGMAFAVSGALAGLAAVLILARRGSVHPAMGLMPVLKAFVAVVLGGFGSLGGAVAGGFLLGFAEVALRAWLPGPLVGFADGFLFAIVGMVLLLRPGGIVTVQEAVRA
jgi:branched-chain amino acid transport system permease protein